MRIDKQVAIGALNSEIARLGAQVAACDDQFSRLAAITTPGLEGQAAQEFRANVRRYAVVVLAHKFFYESVRNADHQNQALVAELPTTDGSVLDTDVAQMRIDAAEAEIVRLRLQKEQAVNSAQKTNAAIALAATVAGPAFSMVARPIDISAVERFYDALISAQFENIEYNRMILALAARYDSQSAAIYQSVDLNVLNQSTNMMASVLNRGTWGSMAWGVDFLSQRYSSGGFAGNTAMNSASSHDNGAVNAWQGFLNGSADAEGATVSSAAVASNIATRGAGNLAAGVFSSEVWRAGMQNRDLGSPVAFSDEPPAIPVGDSQIYSGARGVISGFLHTSRMIGSPIMGRGINNAAFGRISGSGLSGIIFAKYNTPTPTLSAMGTGSARAVTGSNAVGIGHAEMSGRPISAGAGKTSGGSVLEGWRQFSESATTQRRVAFSGVATGTASRTWNLPSVDVSVQSEGRFGGYKVGGGYSIDVDASDQKVGGGFDVDLGRLGVGLGITIDWSNPHDVLPLDGNQTVGTDQSGPAGGGSSFDNGRDLDPNAGTRHHGRRSFDGARKGYKIPL